MSNKPQIPTKNSALIAVIADEGEVNCESRVDTYTTKCVGDDPILGCETASTLIHVSRPKDVESGRMELPIIMMEQEIMETINNNVTVIITGETGCGKTTQIPQFLYEAGYGSGKCPMRSGIIGITQPRRVAVLSTAKRVAFELGLQLGKEVGYQVRHDRRVGDNCSIKFMTDGILLQELKSDFMLRHYSVIILDEAHERSINTDILVGMLSRAVKFRQEEAEKQQKNGIEKYKPNERIYPIKFILMSATLRVEDFTSGKWIFPLSPPVINIQANQFPVTIYFSKKTELIDYIGEAYKKVLKIHKLLPSGGILVFVTGQREVELLCHMLRQASRKFESRSSEVNDESEATNVTGTVLTGGYNLENSDEVLDTVSNSSKQQMDRFSCFNECQDKLDKNDAYFALSSGEDSESDIGSDFEDDECHDESDNGDAYFAVSSGQDSTLDIGSDSKVHESCKVANDIVDFTEAVNSESLRAAFENLTEKSASSTDYNRNEKTSATQDVYSIQPSSLTKQKADRKGRVIGPLHVLPLYAKLPEAAQLCVFEKVKEGERLVVVATNVAETSLTIPGIRYVVDSGREKVKEYNPYNGLESYEIKWTSKASASQRAGRAGRTGPGVCYRLFSSAAFTNLFPDFSTPEILKMPLDYVVLLLKSIGIPEVAKFPFPTPPAAEALENAQTRLKYLEALDSECRPTPLGKTMAQYPISPRHSRFLIYVIQLVEKKRCSVRPNLILGYAVAVAAALSVDNPYSFRYNKGIQTISEGEGQEDDPGSGYLGSQKSRNTKQMRESVNRCSAKFANLKSDALTVAYTLQVFEQSKNRSQFCKENTLHLKIMVEMSKLRKQLLEIVFKERDHRLKPEFSWSHGTMKDVEDNWAVASDKYPLSQEEEDILCEAICAGWIDMVAKRTRRGASSVSSEGDSGSKVNGVRYQASSMAKGTVLLGHWSSVSKAAPEFLVYNELNCTKQPYIYIYRATSVKPEWLVKLSGPLLCNYSAPLTEPKPFYDPQCDEVFTFVIPHFCLRHRWELSRHKVPIEDFEQRIKVFACALLDGQVLPCLKTVKKLMVSPPSIILKAEALSQKRVSNLISKLRARTIDSFAELKKAWKEDSQLLYLELLDFFRKESRWLFDKLWEIMHKEAFLVPPQAETRKRKFSNRG